MAQDVPLVPSNPWYDLTVPFNEPDGSITVVTFEVRWNFRNASWYFSLFSDDNTEICTGVRIVLGGYLGRRARVPFFKQSVLVAIDTASPAPGRGREATFDDLGTRVVLRRFTVQEVMVGRGFVLGPPA